MTRPAVLSAVNRRRFNFHTLPLRVVSSTRPTLLPPKPDPPRDQVASLLALIRSSTHGTHFLQIHARLIFTSLLRLPSLSFPFLSRLAMFSPFRGTPYPRQVFDQFPERPPSVFLYNAMIRAYSAGESADEGVRLYGELRQEGMKADPVTLSFVIKCLVRVSSLPGGVQVHARVLSDGFASDGMLLTNLMELYSGFGKGDDACKVFEEIQERDIVAWNVLISCYLRNNRTKDILGLFDRMVRGESGCEPDNVTCLYLLQACANLSALEFGEKVHGYIEEHGYGGASNLCNSLIAMYSRCGCMDKAYEVFRGMRDKEVVTWTAMISGFAINGFGREAIDAFNTMEQVGVRPEDQTFTGVLCACSHRGLLDEGRAFFDKMSREYSIVPNIHHYGCMVDLLGRSGQLDEAYELILSMKAKPDATIWRTLLGACRIHGHFTLGERVIEHLVELKAEEAGDYVLLTNIYSSVGNWEKVREMRKFMQEKGIETTAGCSSIVLKGQVNEFVANDVSHPRNDEIYEMLCEISQQLKIAGYVAETTSELHNMGAAEKGHALSYHSEKLAIAFGILATPPGTTIRIAKNLRICHDCHNFAKILSGVYNRKLIIRDRTRFHHFQEGSCSCNDYW